MNQTIKTILLLLSLILSITTCQEEVRNNDKLVIDKKNEETEAEITGAYENKSKEDDVETIVDSKEVEQSNEERLSIDESNNREKEVEEGKETTGTDAEESMNEQRMNKEPTQVGPYIDLLGPKLYSFQKESTDDTKIKIITNYTNDILQNTDVIGLYFSADWCGPCREFTPQLVNYYKRITQKRKKSFKIVWISRCRSYETYIQFFVSKFDSEWYAIPLEDASGVIGQTLSNLYKVKGIPTLVLLDDVGNVITTNARNLIPNDKAGIGFPYRNPLITLYHIVVPKSLRLLVRNYVLGFKKQVRGVLLKEKKAKVLDMLSKNKQIQV